MPIDTNILGQQQQPQGVNFGTLSDAMKMGYDQRAMQRDAQAQEIRNQAMQQQAQQQYDGYIEARKFNDAAKMIFKKRIAEGRPINDYNEVIGELYSVDPELTNNFMQNFEKAGSFINAHQKTLSDIEAKDMELRKAKLDFLGNAIKNVKSQEDWNSFRTLAGVADFDDFDLPQQYDPRFISAAINATYSAMDKMKAENERMGAQADMKRAEADVMSAKADIIKANDKESNVPTTPAGLKIRPLEAGQEKIFSDLVNVAYTIDRIGESVKKISNLERGPITGYVFGKNPYAADIKNLENLINQIVPSLARGVFKEVGVLTDRDVERYKKMLPDIKTDPMVAKKLYDEIKGKLNAAYKAELNVLGKSRDISGFEGEQDLFNYANKVFSVEKDVDDFESWYNQNYKKPPKAGG